tara:strand:- start:1369 stop:1740 length:372 start_codon:yes stop_codon:yes gene_type:complete
MSHPTPDNSDDRPELTDVPEMRYQNAYIWFIFVSSLDIMLTWVILRKGGVEVNPVAEQVISAWGLPGAIGFKFALMLFVIISCEIVGRSRDALARKLILLGILISSFPVVWSTTLLLLHWLGS